MLKMLCYRSFKILSYDKSAKLNKCVFNFAFRKSTNLADLNSSGKAFHSLSAAQVKDLSTGVGLDLKLG